MNNFFFFTKKYLDGIHEINSNERNNKYKNDNNYNSLESEIDNFIDSIKRIEEGVAIIKHRIGQIKEICDAMDIDYAEFITLNYNFE